MAFQNKSSTNHNEKEMEQKSSGSVWFEGWTSIASGWEGDALSER